MSSTTMWIFEGVNLLHFPNLLRPAQGPKGAANQVENLPVFFNEWKKAIRKGVGGFNPSEKYLSKWIISPGFGVENKKYLSCHHLEKELIHHWKLT